MGIYEGFCWLVTGVFYGFILFTQIYELLMSFWQHYPNGQHRRLPQRLLSPRAIPAADDMRHVLLRPVMFPDAETLLRPALPSTDTQPEQLLRPYTR
jgi:hypothetical protein